MTTSIPCPSCGANVDMPDDASQVTCPYCNSVVRAQAAPFDPGSAKTIISSHNLDSMKTLISSGNKLEAIKVYREVTGVGLKEAKDAVEKLEQGADISLPDPAPEPDTTRFNNSAEMMDEVKRLLWQENKIEAIKVYREFFHTGLAEAKSAVDQAEADLKFYSAPSETSSPDSDKTIISSSFTTPIVEPAIGTEPFPETPKRSSTWRNIAIGCGVALFFMCCCFVLTAVIFWRQLQGFSFGP